MVNEDDIAVTFLTDGRPCLVIVADEELSDLVALVDQVDRAAAYAGRMPSPAAGRFVHAGRHALAVAALVPQREPETASEAPPPARWITTKEAADHLRVTERAVRKRIAAGSLTARQLGGRWLIDIKEIPHAAA